MAYLTPEEWLERHTGAGEVRDPVPVASLVAPIAAGEAEMDMFAGAGGLATPLPSSEWLKNAVYWLAASALNIPLFPDAVDQIAAIRSQLRDIRAGKMKPPNAEPIIDRNQGVAVVARPARRSDDELTIRHMWRRGG